MKQQIVYLEWEDPTSTDEWTDMSDARVLECYLAKTCGIKINEDHRHICVALNVTEPNDSCSNFIVIPKTHIRRRINLSEI